MKSVVALLQDARDSFQTGPDRASDSKPDVLPGETTGQERTVCGDEEGPAATPQDSSTMRSLGAAALKPADILDALRRSFDSGDFAEWAKRQPEDVKDEITAKVMEAFGRTAAKKQG